MKLVWQYLRSHIAMFAAAVFFLTVETVAALVQPTYMSFIVDQGVKHADVALIWRYGATMLAIALVGAIAALLRNYLSTRVSQSVGAELRADLYAKVTDLSFENIDRLQPASIVTRLTNDVNVIVMFVNSLARIGLKMPITAIGAFVLLAVQVPDKMHIVSAVVVAAALVAVLTARMSRPRFAAMQRALDRLNNVSREFLSSIRVVKAFGAEKREDARFVSAADLYAGAATAALHVPAVLGPLVNLAANAGIVALLWTSQTMDPGRIGHLMAAVNYMTQLLMALGMINMLLNNAMSAVVSSGRVQEVLDERPALAEPADPEPFAVQGALRFEHVAFRYPDAARPALSDVSFDLPAGITLGIIGPTGSGKTTLVNLVPRFYDATGGAVMVDGRDVRDVSPGDLRRGVAVVPQKALLFSGTIAQNLRWGDERASDEDLVRACEAACADEFVRGLPDGYRTVLGQGGVNLSGGQKQRLCIARALLARPRILVLDDCTSALDASTEARVLDGLRRSSEGLTVLLISQRVSTVRRADEILVLENGRVRGFGTHEGLLDACPTYRAIYRSQIGGGDE